jgi:hypothetical protein
MSELSGSPLELWVNARPCGPAALPRRSPALPALTAHERSRSPRQATRTPGNASLDGSTEPECPSLDARRAAPLRRLHQLDDRAHELRDFRSGLHRRELQAGRQIGRPAAGSSPTSRPERLLGLA